MYEYNFNEMRKATKLTLIKTLTQSQQNYYEKLENFNKFQNKNIYNNQNNSNNKSQTKIKKKKIIIKNATEKIEIEKEIIDFEDIDNLKFHTFYNVGFGLFDMTSEFIYKNFLNIKFEYIIFKNCTFKNLKFENCIFIGCQFLNCEFNDIKFKHINFFDFDFDDITYFSSSNFQNCVFENVNLRKSIFEQNKIQNTKFILCNLNKCIYNEIEIESIYFSDCNLKSFAVINSSVKKLEFDDEFITKLNEKTFFDKFIPKIKTKQYYINIYKTYKSIATQFESNRILNISGEYHYLYKYYESKTLEGFSKLKSKIFWLTCGYGERPTYALITSLEIVLIFAIIYMFTGLSIGERLINYNLSFFLVLEKKLIFVDFLEALYFSLVTFTTVGYGDIIPVGVSVILSSIEMILGVTMVGIWTATLARKITR